MKTTQKLGLTAVASAALLLAGCASDSEMEKKQSMKKGSDMGQCHGVNACKGKSACATADSACSGHNSCKGKGWAPGSKADCDAAGGKFMKK